MEVKNFIPVEGVSQQKKKQKKQILSSAKRLTDETINLLNGMKRWWEFKRQDASHVFGSFSPDRERRAKEEYWKAVLLHHLYIDCRKTFR